MPNWVWNRVTVYGKPEQLEEFRQRAGAPTLLEEDPVFSFWNFIKPSDDILDEYRAGEPLSGMDLSANNWYAWNNRNWGTKWDACRPEFFASNSGESIEYSFDTAWGQPEPVFEAMVKQFPHLRFSIYYNEEQGWGGEYTGINGELITDQEWDVPVSHQEYIERQNYCYCVDHGEPIYSDCPKVNEEVTV